MANVPAILRYDAACAALAEARTIDEVQDWADKAAAVKEYARRSRNRRLEIDAIEIRVRARRRCGELLLAMKTEGLLRAGKPAKLSSADDNLATAVSLSDLGLTLNESSESQRIAQIDGNSFERLVERCRAYTEANPNRHSFDVLKPPPDGPINGARSVMGSRVEPHDSLDYFPTPAWATRALIKHCLPQIGRRGDVGRQTAAEPACGEGHIAEVLREYFRDVQAADIHDYGYGHVADFLAGATRCDADWVITNPPFGDKTEAFVLKALDQARVGVAMFVRLQWLETVGRYERLFRDRPPTMIAFFCERVNLCKGRWDPEGGTATAYIWLIWVKGMAPRAPFWIPPGRREALTRPDDVERFTAQPVIRKLKPIDADGGPLEYDPETGEVSGTGADAAPSQAPTVASEAGPPVPAEGSAPAPVAPGSAAGADPTPPYAALEHRAELAGRPSCAAVPLPRVTVDAGALDLPDFLRRDRGTNESSLTRGTECSETS